MALGIPPLYRGFQVAVAGVLTTVAGIQTLFKEKKVYGVADKDGNLIIDWDSCIKFEYHNESTISDAPQEQGAFISYNKVTSPFIISTTGTKSDVDERGAFLDLCETELDSLTLYNFITPEKVYKNVNLISINYNRSAESGYSLIAVDFVFKEVRLNNETRTESTTEPSGAAKKSTGQVTGVQQ